MFAPSGWEKTGLTSGAPWIVQTLTTQRGHSLTRLAR